MTIQHSDIPTFPAYPSYKPSGIEWIGEIPEHWTLKKVKYIFSFRTGFTPPSGKSEYYQDGNYIWINISDLQSKYISDSTNKITDKALEDLNPEVVPAGSLLYSFKLSIGKVAFNTKDCYTNEAIFSIDPSGLVNLDFFYYSLPNQMIENANENIYGAKILNQELIKNAQLIVPSKEEQTAIANFLDHKTAQIDTAIAKHRQLIELLREHRAAIINEAVTKGLNPDAPMKDSGVEWIGEVPAHWGVIAMKRITSRIVVGIAEAATGSYSDEGTPIVRSTNIKNGKIEGELKFISGELVENNLSKAINALDILTVRTGYPGQSAVIPENLSGAQCFTMLISSLKERQNPYFFNFYLNSNSGKEYFGINAWGSAQKNISVPILQFMPVPVPPANEQQQIVNFIETETTRIDREITLAQQEIELLEEYRQSLIAEAVTGKIDVRDYPLN